MEADIEFYDIQRNRKREDSSIESNSYIRDRLQLFSWNSMERSDTTRPTIRKDQPRTVRWMSRKGLHIGYVSRRTEKRYFDNDENGISKL